jgi:hypothetical protein
MVGEVGGDMLFSKVTRPHIPKVVSFKPGLFTTLPKGALLICDNQLFEQLQLTITRAVDDGSFHRCGLILVIDEETLSSEQLLRSFNIRMRSVWASSTIILKPWNGGLPRGADGNFLTLGVADIAKRIDQGLKYLPGLLTTPSIKLTCIHSSGRTIHNGPRALTSPSMALMTSTDECSFLRAVAESPTAQEAVARWSLTTTTRGGARGRHSGRGRCGHRGGALGRYQGYGRSPTIVQSGIHYHTW